MNSKLSPEELQAIKSELAGEIKAQLVEELKDEQTRAREALEKKKDEERKARQAYIEKMKLSPEPWVEILGDGLTNNGLRVELEWNDAFVEYLRKEGITGTDDDQIVQKWVTLLLRDMADDMESSMPTKTEFM